MDQRAGLWYHKGVMVTVITHKDDVVQIANGLENEWDPYFAKDMESLCKRLGMKDLEIIPGSKRRGEYASNVEGYGVMQWDLIWFNKYDRILIVSWRFCCDRQFRLAELPKLEVAMAEVLQNGDQNGRLPKKQTEKTEK